MEKNKIEKSENQLNNHLPLIGHSIRMGALKKLIEADTAKVIPLIVDSLKSFDEKVAKAADKALRSLKNQEAIDVFCNIWYHSREKKLDEILSSAKYIAEKPFEIRVATVLKVGKTELCDNAASLELLLAFFSDTDSVICQNAEKALRSLKNQEAIEVVCEGIINGTIDTAKEVAITAKHQPKLIGKRCLFFVITGQVKKYLELDFEFQYLRTEYQAAGEALQQRIRNAIQQSNDHRLMGLFGEVRKRLVAKDLTEHEAELMLGVYARNHQMEEIFALLFFAPFPVMVKAIDELARVNWQPADEDRRELMGSLIKIRKTVGDKPQLPPVPGVALGPVFQKWIETGRKEYILKSEEQLREIVKTGNPTETVSALSALVAQNLLQLTDHETLLKHPHWLVRMAYLALGNLKPETIFADNPVSVEGGEHWIKSMAPSLLSNTFMQLKPVSLTPDRLQQLTLAIKNAGKDANCLKNWALLLTQLSGYTLRNTIIISSYERRIEDTAISI